LFCLTNRASHGNSFWHITPPVFWFKDSLFNNNFLGIKMWLIFSSFQIELKLSLCYHMKSWKFNLIYFPTRNYFNLWKERLFCRVNDVCEWTFECHWSLPHSLTTFQTKISRSDIGESRCRKWMVVWISNFRGNGLRSNFIAYIN